ncbi:MAG: sigma-70 family RNA polymerase sigma factor [Planctomycetota bacterium]
MHVGATSVESLFDRFRRSGDPDLFEGVVQQTSGELLRTARRLRVQPSEADDLLQETYLAALGAAERFDGRRRLVAWLCGILTNQVRLRRRREQRRAEVEASGPVLSLDDPPEARLLRAELEATLRDCLDGLPLRYREVVRSYYVDGRSADEIARLMGRRPSTVRTQLARGIQHLRRALPDSVSVAALAVLRLRAAGAKLRVDSDAVTSGESAAEPAPTGLAAPTDSTAPIGVAAPGPRTRWGLTAAAAVVVAALILTPMAGARPDAPAADEAPDVAAATPAATPVVNAALRRREAAAREFAPRPVRAASPARFDVRVRLFERQSGDPLAGVALGLQPFDAGVAAVVHAFDGLRVATTDAAGEAVFLGVPAAQLRLRFGDTVGSRVFPASATPLEVPVERVVRVRGTVRDPAGQPVAGAEVWQSQSGGRLWSPPLRAATSDAAGRYEVVLVDSRRGRIWARQAGRGQSNMERLRSRGGVLERDLVLTAAPASVAGRVLDATGQPCRDALVALYAAGPAARRVPVAFARADAGGAFAMATLPAGAYTAVARDRDRAAGASEVRLESGATSVTVHLRAGATLKGRVRGGAASRPVWIAAVDPAMNFGLLWRLGRSDADGAFELKGVLAGPVRLALFDAEHGDLLLVDNAELAAGEVRTWRPTRPPQPLVDHRFERLSAAMEWLTRSRSSEPATTGDAVVAVRGVVPAAVRSDAPAPLTVRLQPATNHAEVETRWARVDETGAFDFAGVVPGSYRLVVVSGGRSHPVLDQRVDVRSGISPQDVLAASDPAAGR